MKNIKFIDLFAGIGGFHEGFSQAGFSCVMASEFNSACQVTYALNHGLAPLGDVTEINPKDIPDHRVLTAGFPCQPFSICGSKRGFEDTRGTLFFDICRIASEKRTDVLVLENVKHLIHHDKGRTFNTIINTLEEMGYQVSFSLLNAVHFGVPQNRERIIIVASKIGAFSFEPLKQFRSITSVLRDFIEPENDEMEYLEPSEYTLLDAPIKQPKSGLMFVGYRNKKIRINGTRPNTEYLSRVHKQPNRIYSIDGTHPTLPSQETAGRFFIYIPETNHVRKLTLRECYRIMGFREDFKINKSKPEAYKQIGNSVCVPMVEAVAQELKKQLFKNFDKENMHDDIRPAVNQTSREQLYLFR